MGPFRLVFLLVILSFLLDDAHGWRRRRRRRRSCNSSPCEWEWGPCSQTCGEGTRSPVKTKNQGNCGACNMPQPQSCNTQCCAMNCNWNAWDSWTECSLSCGRGSQIRERTEASPATCGGHCGGSSSEERLCNEQCCPIDCKWCQWGEWGSCSKSCDNGVKIRSRTPIIEAACGGNGCEGTAAQNMTCNEFCCPDHCHWSQWTEWTPCSKSCGVSERSRSREVEIDPTCASHHCSGLTYENQACYAGCCPVNCSTTSWSQWSECSFTCGGSGVKRRSRSITQQAECRGTPCEGQLREEKPCARICFNEGLLEGGVCRCAHGWTGVCCEQDVNECAFPSHNSCREENMICINTSGGFECGCEEGYEMVGQECQGQSPGK